MEGGSQQGRELIKRQEKGFQRSFTSKWGPLNPYICKITGQLGVGKREKEGDHFGVWLERNKKPGK